MHEFWTIPTVNMTHYIAKLHKYGGGESLHIHKTKIKVFNVGELILNTNQNVTCWQAVGHNWLHTRTMSFFSMVGSYSKILYVVVFDYEMWLYGETRNKKKEEGTIVFFPQSCKIHSLWLHIFVRGHGEDLITWLQH